MVSELLPLAPREVGSWVATPRDSLAPLVEPSRLWDCTEQLLWTEGPRLRWLTLGRYGRPPSSLTLTSMGSRRHVPSGHPGAHSRARSLIASTTEVTSSSWS